MPYTMADLEQRTGLTARTIREYIRLKFVRAPVGHGPAAVYDEMALLQAVSIVRMRAQKEGWDKIAEQIPDWSLAKLRAFVKKTDPPAPEPAPPPPDPLFEGDPASPRARLPRASAEDRKAELDTQPSGPDAELPGGQGWVLAPLLPGMVLMVRDDAAPLVRRAAAEIVERYGT